MAEISKVGERLTEAMIESDNITSAKLAELIGVTVQTVNCWRRGETLLKLSNLIAVANVLNCTIDFLVGRSEKALDFVPQVCPPFYEHLRYIMEERSVSWYKLTKDTSIKDSYLYLWKKGADTKIPALITLADYFDCTIDYLVGRER